MKALKAGAVAVFFVAPDGNDAWLGQHPSARDARGPFATLNRALQASRVVRKTNSTAVVRIVLRQGTWFLPEPLVITPQDSKLEIVAYPGEKPVLSGGREISGWQPASLGDRQVWVADVPQVRSGEWRFRQLWVNGRRAVRARHPDNGYFEVVELPDKTPEWNKGHSRLRFAAGDFKNLRTITNAEVIVMNRWVESRLPITSIDESQRLASFAMRSVFQLAPKDPYYIEGAMEHLTTPGEWCLDPTAGRLYYYPEQGEQLQNARILAPVLPQLVRLEGRPESGQVIEEIKLVGLTFSHTEWQFPTHNLSKEIWPGPAPGVGGFGQAAVGVPGAVWGKGVRRSLIQDCTFIHLGGYGLELEMACSNNKVSYCEFTDLGAGGVKLGETTMRHDDFLVGRDNEISDCHIYDGAKLFHSAIGIWIGQTPGNRILHNHIHDFYYTGISVGWSWGYHDAFATNTLVAFNHVHHIGQKLNSDGPILSDMAGIYTLGRHTGSLILNNLWHDIAGLRYGGWGIYFDEGTSNIRAISNVVYRTTHGGFHQHYGMSNAVHNNIFAYARDFQVQRTRPEAHLSFVFTTNIVYFDTGTLLGGNWSGTVTNFFFDRNTYFDARPDKAPDSLNVGHTPWARWRGQGQDSNSIIANPKFDETQSNRFTLQPDSPAFLAGFKPIDLSRVGVRPRK